MNTADRIAALEARVEKLEATLHLIGGRVAAAVKRAVAERSGEFTTRQIVDAVIAATGDGYTPGLVSLVTNGLRRLQGAGAVRQIQCSVGRKPAVWERCDGPLARTRPCGRAFGHKRADQSGAIGVFRSVLPTLAEPFTSVDVRKAVNQAFPEFNIPRGSYSGLMRYLQQTGELVMTIRGGHGALHQYKRGRVITPSGAVATDKEAEWQQMRNGMQLQSHSWDTISVETPESRAKRVEAA